MTNSDYLEKILDLKVKYQAEVKELKESLGADMPLIESQKLTKIAYFESFIEEFDGIVEKTVSDKTKINKTLHLFKRSVESTEMSAKGYLEKQSDYGGYHGGVNNTCKAIYPWISRLEKEINNELE